MTKSKLAGKLKKLGFKFTQSEFCTNDSFIVVLDCFPYLVESGKNQSLFFKSWNEFIVFYNKHKTLGEAK